MPLWINASLPAAAGWLLLAAAGCCWVAFRVGPEGPPSALGANCKRRRLEVGGLRAGAAGRLLANIKEFGKTQLGLMSGRAHTRARGAREVARKCLHYPLEGPFELAGCSPKGQVESLIRGVQSSGAANSPSRQTGSTEGRRPLGGAASGWRAVHAPAGTHQFGRLLLLPPPPLEEVIINRFAANQNDRSRARLALHISCVHFSICNHQQVGP